jgi:hypothetical protein
MKRLILATVVGLMLLPGHAQACMAENFTTSLIHNALPQPLPTGAIIAEVRFESTTLGNLWEGVRVEVRRMIQGDYAGRTLIVRPIALTSCSRPFENGGEGLIVAIPIGNVNGVLVVDAIEAGEYDGYRLRDGFQLSDLPQMWLARHRTRVEDAAAQRTSR